MANRKPKPSDQVNTVRRRLLGAATGGVALAASGGLMSTLAGTARAQDTKPIRWGFVGTGGIANSMARVVKLTPLAELVAVSSRRMSSAEAFANQHGATRAFDSWAEMCAWDGVDAIYVATPTSVREEISIAAANGGKHVLAEKPFASLPSVQRIVEACRANDVAFMDGTHFVHHPRTARIKTGMDDLVGDPWSVASAFQFGLGDRGNIRFNPELEPMGAIGDAGWYNMRAAAEFLDPSVGLRSSRASLRRDDQTRAAIGGSGILVFDDGSTSTWNCGFDSGAVVMDLRITGPAGVINIDNFLSQDRDNSATFLLKQGGWSSGKREDVTVDSTLPGAALMFEDLAAAAADKSQREQWIRATERTQMLLDSAWAAALDDEQR